MSKGGSYTFRVSPILAHSVTSGMPTQKRLDSNRELDVIVASDIAAGNGDPVMIGWTASGPANK
jgi:hypothetical protein